MKILKYFVALPMLILFTVLKVIMKLVMKLYEDLSGFVFLPLIILLLFALFTKQWINVEILGLLFAAAFAVLFAIVSVAVHIDICQEFFLNMMHK